MVMNPVTTAGGVSMGFSRPMGAGAIFNWTKKMKTKKSPHQNSGWAPANSP